MLYIGNHLIKAKEEVSGAYKVKAEIKTIAHDAFEFCNGLTSVGISNSVTNIDNYAFYGCSGLTSVDIPNSVTNIGDYAFSGCSGLTSADIPNSVTSIGQGVFWKCEGLTEITIPNSVTSIKYGAFSGCSSLQNIEIPNSVTSIAGSAFEGCRSLTSIVIPDSVTIIMEGAFSGCGALTNINIPNSITIINNYTFSGCESLSSIVIPSSVTSIGNNAFQNCINLTRIEIPYSVTSIGGNVFGNTGYYNNTANWENNVLYIGNHLIKAKEEVSGAYKVKAGTKTIAYYAFEDCKGLTSVEIPNSVISIGTRAFSLCGLLTSIKIPNSVTNIGSYAFSGCSGLINVDIPNSVTSIGQGAFSNTGYYNNTANWDNGVLYLGKYLIDTKESISGSYAVKDGTIVIGYRAFVNCEELISVEIPNSLISINDYAFQYCYKLTSITIPNSVRVIGNGAFSGCNRLTDVYYLGSENEWNNIEIGDYNERLTKSTIHFMPVQSCDHKPAKAVTENKVAATYDMEGSYDSVVYCKECKAELSRTKKTIAKLKKTSLTKASVTGITAKVYSGKAITQSITVKLSGKTLKNGTDYTATYKNNKNVGKATVTITGKNAYSGTITKTFVINPKGTSVSKLTAKSKGFEVKWGKQATQTTGYEIQLATDSKFTKNKKTVTVTKNGTTSKTVTKLTAKKKYYVRIRTYKTVSGTKYYSSWSSAKTVTTKK